MTIINGTPGDDVPPTLDGGNDDDLIHGYEGNDTANGFGGSDTIYGGAVCGGEENEGWLKTR